MSLTISYIYCFFARSRNSPGFLAILMLFGFVGACTNDGTNNNPGEWEATTLNLSLETPKELMPALPPPIASVPPVVLDLISDDYSPLDSPVADLGRYLDAYIDRALQLSANQPVETLFDAWDAFHLLTAINHGYLLTEDPKYLDSFAEFVNYFWSVRLDARGFTNFEGEVKPQWARLEKYTIYNLSPYYSYTEEEKLQLPRVRNWVNSYFSDVNYSGLFLEPMLRFAQIVLNNRIHPYENLAQQIVSDAGRVFDSHESEWTEESLGAGFYVFPRNAPFYLDGIELPINEAAIFGIALLRLYQLTGSERFLNRAVSMWRRWSPLMVTDPHGYIAYPYVFGDWFYGTNEDDDASINSPVIAPNQYYETFHKAGFTLRFMQLLYLAIGSSDIKRMLERFYLILAATKEMATPISPFPASFAFGWPKDNYHTQFPYGLLGWEHLIAEDRQLLANALTYILNDNYLADYISNVRLALGLRYVTERKHVVIKQINSPATMTFSPTFLPEDDADAGCMLFSPVNAIAFLRFDHRTPKNNRLFLFIKGHAGHRVRLEIDAESDAFKGYVFIPANHCINFFWETSLGEFAYPASEEENIITSTIYYSEW